jgi:hypothetical protein
MKVYNMNKNQWMCHLCFPNAKEIGMLLPGYSLITEKNKFYILAGQGHKGDILLSFKKPPVLDPLKDMSKEEEENLKNEDPIWKEVDDFFLKAEEETKRWKLSPEDGYTIIKKAIESKKYDQKKDGYNFCYWLYSKAAELIKEESDHD